MTDLAERTRILCFAASYAVALALEVLQLLRPRTVQRILATTFGIGGLVAHTLFLSAQRPLLASQFGTLLFLAWILAVFYLYGSLHHLHVAWSIFVLPVIFGLVVVAAMTKPVEAASSSTVPFSDEGFWRTLHVSIFVLAAVGVCVAFVSSAMYLVQARRLKRKTLPGQGLRLLSLERLDEMNRRAINLAFPLLTLGLLIGGARLMEQGTSRAGWTDPRIISSVLLWLVFAAVLYLRYGFHLGGRRMALLTVCAFALLVVSLITTHSLEPGGGP
jgi:ABC-type transport system involved in cytochrome c biogenesis permease subunit